MNPTIYHLNIVIGPDIIIPRIANTIDAIAKPKQYLEFWYRSSGNDLLTEI